MGTLLRWGRHTVTTKQCRIHRQPLSRHSFAGCDAVTAGGRQVSLASNSWRSHTCRGGGTKARDGVEDVGLRRALDIRLRPWAFRPGIGLLTLRYLAGGEVRAVATNGLESGRFQGFLTGNMSNQVITVRCGKFFLVRRRLQSSLSWRVPPR